MKYVLILLSFVCITNNILAQEKFDGSWQGKLTFGQEVKIILTINSKDKSTKLDIPTQGATGIKSSEVNINGDSIEIRFEQLKVTYQGALVENKIKGKWKQRGLPFPLTLEKMAEEYKLNRPQEPKPPYSYNTEDIIYHNADRSIQYGATITTPKDGKKHPALILISGSGQQDRNEEIFGHKPFWVIADQLTKKGYVVLRVDDRGMGKTTGDLKNATSADFAQDVMVSLDYLKTRKEVDKKKIGLLGHSEGGMIVPMVAVERAKDIDFIILTAGPGVKVVQLMTEQNEAALTSMGIKEEWAKKYSELYYAMVSAIPKAKNKEEYGQLVNTAVNNWKDNTDDIIVKNTTGITNETTQKNFANQFVQLYDNAWMRYFISYDPQPVLKQLSCKVLALNGEKDIQVLPKSNLAGIESALKKSKSKLYETKEIPGVNHLFQDCDKCTVQEYGQLEQTFKPEVLDMITNWLDEHVK